MQIKAQRKQSQGSSPSSNYARYNICFAYSNSRKHSDSKAFQQSTHNLSVSLNKKPNTEHFPTTRTSEELSYRYRDTSLFQTARHREPVLVLQQKRREDIQYIANPFPQRKKKSGEHQLIKLLMKYSINAAKQPCSSSKHALFSEDTPKMNKGIRGRSKNLSRLNWIKDRYCANRDKEQGVINAAEGFGFANRTNPNAPLLRASLLPKRLF